MRFARNLTSRSYKLSFLLALVGAAAGCAVDDPPTAAAQTAVDDTPVCPTNFAGDPECPVCGDGSCDFGEDVSCPSDCPPPPDDPIQWSSWLDRDAPGGTGDWETRADFTVAQVGCASPVAIDARTLSGVPWQSTGEVLTVSPSVGLICLNASQPDGVCQDYQVRFGCGSLDWSPLFQAWHANNSLFSGDIEYFVPASVPVPTGRFVGEMSFDSAGNFSALQLAPNDAHYTDFGSFSLSGNVITASFPDRFRGTVTEHYDVVELTSSVLRFRRF
jgi:hypothetical protein